MQDKDIRLWLRLHRTPKLSASVLCRLIEATTEPDDIFQLSTDELKNLRIPPAIQQSLRQVPDQLQLEADYTLLQQQHIQLLPLSADYYPELLKQIPDPPPLLYVRGQVSLLNRPQLAMVGSRHASRQGCENAFRFAREFSRQGFTVTSGLALGVDTECHRGALTETGSTVAVLGTGVDVIYPARNRALFDEIAEQGALVSEFPLNTGPRRSLFPKRNRLISGMSLGVLVVEAALQSGSLITARCALEQNREVYAIPGSIHGVGNRGCHAMIREGATLVETAADVVDELSGWLPKPTAAGLDRDDSCEKVIVDVTEREQQLLTLIGYDPAPVDLIVQRSGWAMAEIMALLTSLELKGLLANEAGCFQRLSMKLL